MIRVGRLAVMVLAACGSGDATSPPTAAAPAPHAIAITVAPSVFECRHTQMVATVFHRNGKPLDPQPPVSWSSSAPAIARVSPTGIVSGLMPGTADIIVSSGLDSARRSTIVYPRAVNWWFVWIRPEPAALAVGDSLQLTAIADANDALFEYPVTWESRSPAVATISSSGMVRARASGEALIEARFVEPADGNDPSICPLRSWLGATVVKVR